MLGSLACFAGDQHDYVGPPVRPLTFLSRATKVFYLTFSDDTNTIVLEANIFCSFLSQTFSSFFCFYLDQLGIDVKSGGQTFPWPRLGELNVDNMLIDPADPELISHLLNSPRTKHEPSSSISLLVHLPPHMLAGYFSLFVSESLCV